MTSLPTARALARTGLVWEPARGDRFVIPDRGMDAEVFVLSDMTIEAHDHPTGRVLGFNGTTEWALDSVAADEVLWLPAEGHLREQLGEAFTALRRQGSDWVVTTRTERGDGQVADADPEEAYALALLSVRARTARDLLPLAAQGLARRLAALGDPGAVGGAGGAGGGGASGDGSAGAGWEARAPDGVRSVREVAAAVLGAPVDAAWPTHLADVLTAWAGAASGDAAVAEAGAQGVLVDLLVATWDVARATGGDEHLHPACVRVALEHVRGWGAGLAAPAAGDSAPALQAELVALTGR